MRIEELTTGTNITFLVIINGEQLSFNSKIQEVYPKKHFVLADAVYHNEKIISFRGKNIIVNLLVTTQDEKPQLFKNITVITMKKPDGSLCYSLTTITESKPYNRRESYRCYVGVTSSMQCGPNRAATEVIIRDVSISGFSVTCDTNMELQPNQTIHVVLNDYIEELAENFSFHLYGIVARIQEFDDGKVLYGCRFNNFVRGLEAYIMKKERIRLRNSNGGKL